MRLWVPIAKISPSLKVANISYLLQSLVVQKLKIYLPHSSNQIAKNATQKSTNFNKACGSIKTLLVHKNLYFITKPFGLITISSIRLK
ncbi:Uncharacterised protein [Sphingobacterium multivorum]|uniref:Uncharacterized protein n=1 Tax=Sphingobacterium multivorum TaxID=28454 RepID=A0A2X2ITQ3_SPHMU|nr:Uncharacterised protein [Sphingobacterium multivorum]SUJ15076.1 Uncharacterised protein [Sphingobacterium multivorum]